MTPAQAGELWAYMTPQEQKEAMDLIAADVESVVWRPLPGGPQEMAYNSVADVIGFGGAAGGGKGAALDTLLATPAGWTTMGEVQAGDTVFDQTGAPCRVTAVSEINHRPCYRLTFDDGSTLVADDVHRWVTLDAKELAALTRQDPQWRAARRAGRPSRAKPTTSSARLAALAKLNVVRAASAPPTGTMRSTASLANTLKVKGRTNHAIPTAGALQTVDADLIVPPYTLGAWLGDGSSRNGQLTGEDAYVWERIESEGFEVRHYVRNAQAHSVIGLKVMLRELGVLENKHVPVAYMRASYAQRLSLLQGLMDTDGHAALDGGCEFDGVNETLVNDVRRLVSTLGIKSTIQQGVAKLNGRVIGPKWRVKFTTSLPVFGMPRKAERLKQETRRTTRMRYLVSCEPVPSVPTRCIAVDSPTRQYLLGESLVPTHNTDLACGKALTQHTKTAMFRRVGTELVGIIDRLVELFGNRDGYNGQDKIWRRDGLQIELASVPNNGDEKGHQGRPKDLLVIDEAANFLESQVRFLMGWVRSTKPGQHSQTLMTFNPPTSAEGRWVVSFFAPWIDKKYAGPDGRALPGELRYVGMVPGTNGVSKDVWFGKTNPGQFVIIDGQPVFEFDPARYAPEEIITPQSRTFIPSRISDNPYLANTGYMAVLQAMPEPLRSQMLYGDFEAGMQDDPWQVIPTAWVEAAMLRWIDQPVKGEMLNMGVDVARGGQDNTTIAKRHKVGKVEKWFDKLKEYPGKETPSGHHVAGLVIGERRDLSPIMIDVIGVGASPYDVLKSSGQDVYGVNVAEKATHHDKSGRLSFMNLRSQLWWALREDLDPAANNGFALPPDPELLVELCAPKWSMSGLTIKVESREEIIERIGRSPDRATAVMLANMEMPKVQVLGNLSQSVRESVLNHDPLANLR